MQPVDVVVPQQVEQDVDAVGRCVGVAEVQPEIAAEAVALEREPRQ
jgi:hypothetical protein